MAKLKKVIPLLLLVLCSRVYSQSYYISESQLSQLEMTIENQQKLLQEWNLKSQNWQIELNQVKESLQRQNKQLQTSENIRKLTTTTTAVFAATTIVVSSILIFERR